MLAVERILTMRIPSLFKLDRMNISKQIGVISGLVFVGMVFVLVSYVMGANKVSNLHHELNEDGERLHLVNAIQYEFLNSRRSEKDFLIRRDEKYAQKHAANVDAIHADISKLREMLVLDTQKERLDMIKRFFDEYVAQFALVRENVIRRGLTHTEGLGGVLRDSVRSVEGTLKEYDNAGLMITMLMMRRHEKDFMMRQDPKYIARMDERLKEFKAGLAYSDIAPEDQANIVKLMERYHRDFKALAEIELANAKEIKELSRLFAESSPQLDILADEIQANYNALLAESKVVEQQTFILLLTVIVGVTVMAVLMAVVIGRKISKPVVSLTDALLQLAESNYDVEIPGQGRGDEIGKMANSILVLKENSIEAKRLEEEQKQLQAVQLERGKNLEMLTSDFEVGVSDLINGLAAASTELDSTAQSMSDIAKRTTEQSSSMANVSRETTSNIHTVASASEELSASIKELSKQVQTTSRAANTATDDVDKASQQIEGLLQASEKIGDVVNLIRDIAEQTNLLALNATIESARAGEAGKGFAVVANEVKALATETSKATEQITEEVQTVQTEIRSAVEAVRNVEGKINDVNTSAAAIAAAIEEQNATTNEITRNTQTSASNMQELDGNVTNVNEAAQTTGSAANDVLGASSELSQKAEDLKLRISEFLKEVKVA